MRKAYQEQITKIEDKYAEQLNRFAVDYANALVALDQSLSEGNLEGVMAVRAEQDRFKAAQEIPDEATVETPSELKGLQEKSRALAAGHRGRESEGDCQGCIRAFSKLELLKKALTQDAKVDDALLVKAEIDAVRKRGSRSRRQRQGGHTELRVNRVKELSCRCCGKDWCSGTPSTEMNMERSPIGVGKDM